MKKGIRLAVLAAVSSLALAAAGSAFAVYTPTLAISPGSLSTGAVGAQTIKFTSSAADDATAKITIYAPLGYTVNLGQAVGAKIGKVNAQIIAVALGGALLPLTGDIVVDDPAKYTSVAASVGCAGAAAHNAVWLLNLSVAGQTLAVPVYVDKTTGGEATIASLKLQTCLSSPYATIAQGGNSVGAKAVSVDFTFNGVLTNPSAAGDNVWRALFTPWATNSGTVTNPAGTIESRSIVRLPAALTLLAGAGGKLTGGLVENHIGIGGVRVEIWGGPSAKKLAKLGTVKTKGAGDFSYAGKKGLTYQAKVALAARGNTTSGCAGVSPFAPVPCATATIGGWTASSKVVKAK